MVHRFRNDRPVTHLCESASLSHLCLRIIFDQLSPNASPTSANFQLLPGEYFPGTPLETSKSIKEAAISHSLTNY